MQIISIKKLNHKYYPNKGGMSLCPQFLLSLLLLSVVVLVVVVVVEVVVFTWNYLQIIGIRLEYLKPYTGVQIICIKKLFSND